MSLMGIPLFESSKIEVEQYDADAYDGRGLDADGLAVEVLPKLGFHVSSSR